MIRICFLIRQLNDGGAQRQLVELVSGLDKSKFAVTVMTLYDGGRFRAELLRIPDVNYVCVGKRSRWDVLGFIRRLLTHLRRLRPQLVHGYLPLSNILIAILKPLLPGTRIVWGIRASYMDFSRYHWLERVQTRGQSFLSRLPDLIIVNSQAAKTYHQANGIPAAKMVVIPNGIDTERFHPNAHLRDAVRHEWSIQPNQTLIGIVGRLDPMKDLPTFLNAAALLAKQRHDVCFVCVGDGPAAYRQELHDLSNQLGLSGSLTWAGARSDMTAVYNAIDLLTSSSCGESFPNVVAEAMACGVPCVVTDVGDSAWIVGELGVVVQPGDPEALYSGWQEFLAESDVFRSARSDQVRSRIVDLFSREHLVQETSEKLAALL